MSKHVIEMKEITKKFGDFVANDHINLSIQKGEIHALLGGKRCRKINSDEYAGWLVATNKW